MSSPSPSPLPWSPSLLSSYRCILFDCDGVLWHENTPVPGANSVLNSLSSLGKLLIFVTNNSSKSRQQILEKFRSLGFNFPLEEKQIIGSAYAAAVFVSEKLPKFNIETHTALILGDVGIGVELRSVGVKTLELRKLIGNRHLTRNELINFVPDPTIGAVLIGIDDELTYSKVSLACSALRLPTSPAFISTNQDSTLPTTGAILPGGGSCVSMVSTASERLPVNLGKPEPFMLELICEKFQVEKSEILMVGDRLDTDILFGVNFGVHSMLVETGIHKREHVENPQNSIIPTFIVDSVNNLIE